MDAWLDNPLGARAEQRSLNETGATQHAGLTYTRTHTCTHRQTHKCLPGRIRHIHTHTLSIHIHVTLYSHLAPSTCTDTGYTTSITRHVRHTHTYTHTHESTRACPHRSQAPSHTRRGAARSTTSLCSPPPPPPPQWAHSFILSRTRRMTCRAPTPTAPQAQTVTFVRASPVHAAAHTHTHTTLS